MDSLPETEGEALVLLERHVSGALGAVRVLRRFRAKLVIRELRLTGSLALLRSLRAFLRSERSRKP